MFKKITEQTEQDMHDSTVYNDLFTRVITLMVILGDIDKTNKLNELEINNKLKKLEEEKINELEMLEE